MVTHDMGSPYQHNRTPPRSNKRPSKAPPSPAAAMLLQAAELLSTNVHDSPRSTKMSRMTFQDTYGNTLSPALRDSNDLFNGGILAPPSPAVTPSRLLFSPASMGEKRQSTQAQPTISPFTMLSACDLDGQSPDVGSIWKEPASANKRKISGTTARRPLLANFMTPATARRKTSEDPTPLPTTTPKAKVKVKDATTPVLAADGSDKKKKPRKQYSTAGRPRNRGQYKCGKCGFKPKKAKHDCEAEKIRRAALKAKGLGSDDEDPCSPGCKSGSADETPPGSAKVTVTVTSSPAEGSKPDRQRVQPPPPPQL